VEGFLATIDPTLLAAAAGAVLVLGVLLLLRRRRGAAASQTSEPAAPADGVPAAPHEGPAPELIEAWVQFLRDHVTRAANGLNNRLSAIGGMARQAAGSNLTKEQRESLEKIQQEIHWATNITGSLLNRVTSDAPEIAPPTWNVLSDAPKRQGHILIVEDDDSNRMVMTRLFRKLGHTVVPVASGYEAYDALQERKPDCIISDLRMPTLGGKTLYEQVESKLPSLASRFVFVTGDYTRPESYEFLLKSGRPVVGKPYELDQLLAAVATVLAQAGVIADRSGDGSDGGPA
jgi:CheY-like chemotaxis protein